MNRDKRNSSKNDMTQDRGDGEIDDRPVFAQGLDGPTFFHAPFSRDWFSPKFLREILFLRQAMIPSDFPGVHQAGEVLEGAIIGGLGFCVEATPGKLSHLEVIGDALAADAFSRARIIGAIAPG